MGNSKSSGVRFVLIALAAIVCALSACSRPLPSEVETEASLATADWMDRTYGIEQSSQVRKLLARVIGRLASSISGTALERESKLALEGELHNYRWEVYLVRDPKPNAFSVGSGIIFITEGLLARLQTEAELAAVLAHEMSHQLLGHTREAIAAQGSKQSEMPTASYSLNRELEADTLSLKILKVSRYDVRAAGAALTIGYRESGSLVSSLPPDWFTERLANIEQRTAELGQFLPATDSTREFNKVKRMLFG